MFSLIFVMLQNTPNVNNIKISLYLVKHRCLLENIKQLFSSNSISSNSSSFFILRASSFIYTIFHNGHINVTNLKNHSDINRCISFILQQLNYSDAYDYKIDNLSSSGSIGKIPCFVDFLHRLKDHSHIISVKYANSIFCGAFVKFQTGTICLSKTGKFSIVGCKSLEDINKCVQILHQLKKQHVMQS